MRRRERSGRTHLAARSPGAQRLACGNILHLVQRRHKLIFLPNCVHQSARIAVGQFDQIQVPTVMQRTFTIDDHQIGSRQQTVVPFEFLPHSADQSQAGTAELLAEYLADELRSEMGIQLTCVVDQYYRRHAKVPLQIDQVASRRPSLFAPSRALPSRLLSNDKGRPATRSAGGEGEAPAVQPDVAWRGSRSRLGSRACPCLTGQQEGRCIRWPRRHHRTRFDSHALQVLG